MATRALGNDSNGSRVFLLITAECREHEVSKDAGRMVATPFVSRRNLPAALRAYATAALRDVDMSLLRQHVERAAKDDAPVETRHVLTLRLAGVDRGVDGTAHSMMEWTRYAVDQLVVTDPGVLPCLLTAALVMLFGASPRLSVPLTLCPMSGTDVLDGSRLLAVRDNSLSIRHPLLARCVLEVDGIDAKSAISQTMQLLQSDPTLLAQFVLHALLHPSGDNMHLSPLITAAMAKKGAGCPTLELESARPIQLPFSRRDVSCWTHEGRRREDKVPAFRQARVDFLIVLSQAQRIRADLLCKNEETDDVSKSVLWAKEASDLALSSVPSRSRRAASHLERTCRWALARCPTSPRAKQWARWQASVECRSPPPSLCLPEE